MHPPLPTTKLGAAPVNTAPTAEKIIKEVVPTLDPIFDGIIDAAYDYIEDNPGDLEFAREAMAYSYMRVEEATHRVINKIYGHKARKDRRLHATKSQAIGRIIERVDAQLSSIVEDLNGIPNKVGAVKQIDMPQVREIAASLKEKLQGYANTPINEKERDHRIRWLEREIAELEAARAEIKLAFADYAKNIERYKKINDDGSVTYNEEDIKPLRKPYTDALKKYGLGSKIFNLKRNVEDLFCRPIDIRTDMKLQDSEGKPIPGTSYSSDRLKRLVASALKSAYLVVAETPFILSYPNPQEALPDESGKDYDVSPVSLESRVRQINGVAGGLLKKFKVTNLDVLFDKDRSDTDYNDVVTEIAQSGIIAETEQAKGVLSKLYKSLWSNELFKKFVYTPRRDLEISGSKIQILGIDLDDFIDLNNDDFANLIIDNNRIHDHGVLIAELELYRAGEAAIRYARSGSGSLTALELTRLGVLVSSNGDTTVLDTLVALHKLKLVVGDVRNAMKNSSVYVDAKRIVNIKK